MDFNIKLINTGKDFDNELIETVFHVENRQSLVKLLRFT